MATNNATNTSSPITVAQGGTGVATLTTAYGVLCAGTTATGNVQTLASLGSSTQVLTSNGAGALPSFQAAAGASSGLTFIGTASATSSATVDFANLLTSTYDNYLVVIEDFSPDTNNIELELLVGTGGTPTYQTSGYTGFLLGGSGGGASAYVGASATANFSLSKNAASSSTLTRISNDTATKTACGYVYIHNANSSSNDKNIEGRMTYQGTSTASGAEQAVISGGRWSSATVITSLRFQTNSGNITNGTFKLYGFKNS